MAIQDGRFSIGRPGITALTAAIFSLALALGFLAASGRYHVTPLVGLYAMRTDRLTGRVELCGARHPSEPVVCRPAASNPRETLAERAERLSHDLNRQP